MNKSSPYTYRLFKYRSIAADSRNYTCRIVADGQIYYAAPRQFNDPFDCLFSMNMDGAPLSPFGLSKCGEIKAFAENWFREEINKDTAILSLSKINDSILMWSHYADCHRGVCLELTITTSEKLHEVRYSKTRPQFYFADMRQQDRNEARFRNSIISTLTTKSTLWAYEKEWRCIDSGGPGERHLPHGMLTGIVFGWHTSDRDKQMIREWVASGGQQVTFYQAEQREGAFALDIKRIG